VVRISGASEHSSASLTRCTRTLLVRLTDRRKGVYLLLDTGHQSM